MSGWLIALIIVGAVIVIISVIIAVVHERLTIRRSVAVNAFAFVEAQLSRRHALAEELSKRVPGKSGAELGEVLATAAAATEKAAETPHEVDVLNAAMAGETALAAAVSTAIQQVGDDATELREAIDDAEEHLAFATTTFNWAVDAYNRSRKRFPGRGFARLIGFRIAETWSARPDEVSHGG